MIGDYLTKDLEERVLERFNSTDFHCILCNNGELLEKSNIQCEQDILNFHPPGQEASRDNEFRTGLRVIAFLICPQCKNKFFVKILDQGKLLEK
jgi:hypothetical protein